MPRFNIHLIAGARPNFVKIAALWHAFQAFRKKHPRSKVALKIINTGQHYDYLMAKKLFEDFALPAPYRDLRVGSDSHAAQTAKIMVSYEKLIAQDRPDLTMVVGDVNSTMACSVVAVKLGIPVAHVEAGLRSRDRTMPEEINRLVTDSISNLLFTTSKDADINLKKEGVSPDKIFIVGNVMVDTLLMNLPAARKSKIKQRLGIKPPYAVLTLHRPSNVDKEGDLLEILKALKAIQRRLPIVFPVHPRTAARLKKILHKAHLDQSGRLFLIPPLGYHDFINLLADADLALTDSGGIQEETTVLKVPCLTLRDNTERPVTIGQGTNILAGRKAPAIIRLANQALDRKRRSAKTRRPPYWDGKAAERIWTILARKFRF